MSDQHEHGEASAQQGPETGEQREQEHPAQAEVREDAREAADEHEALNEDAAAVDIFDDSDAGPEHAVDESLRNALDQMRDESQRISELGTGDEQVEAAERFVDAAGKLDERIGSHARAEDERGR